MILTDVSLVIRHRLNELSLEQRDLATTAQVTESYIPQLLTGKKAPPMAHRTDMYEKMEAFLKLPCGELSKLADLQRIEELKRKLTGYRQGENTCGNIKNTKRLFDYQYLFHLRKEYFTE